METFHTSLPLRSIVLLMGCLFILLFGIHPVWAELRLTPEEHDWLREHPVLHHAPDPDYAPFEFRNADGQIEGIAPDTLRRVAQILGVRIETVPIQSWAESLEMVKNRDADLVTVATPTPERESFLAFTKPYAIFPDLLLMRQDVKGQYELGQLAGKTLAGIRGWAINEAVQQEYPEIRFRWLPDVKEAMTAVSLGEVDGVLLNRATAGYWAQRLKITNLRNAGETKFMYRLSFAARKDWPVLQSVMDKALGEISAEEHRRIQAHWVSLKDDAGSSFPKFWWMLAGGTLIAFLGGTLFLNWHLRHQVLRHKNVLNQERFMGIARNDPRIRWLIVLLPWLVLVAGLAITQFWYQATKTVAYEKLQDNFEFQAQEITLRIRQQMAAYEQILKSVRGLFNASEKVERPGFHDFVDSLQLQQNYPGIQGVGFSLLLPAEEKDHHIAAIRREGFPDYTIRPAGDRAVYSSIIYLEPFADRNLRAFGYDMYSESVRRVAMDQARDSGLPSLSGKVILVQEEGQRVQAGFLMYVPVYRNGASHATLEDRRANLVGWAYSPFRMDDLMSGILGRHPADFDLEIFDCDCVLPEAIMYDSDGSQSSVKTVQSLYSINKRIDIASHPWTISIHSMAPFESQVNIQLSLTILYTGLVASILLSVLVWLLVHGRTRAISLAQQMTVELQESRFRWKFAVEGSGFGLWDWDMQAGTLFFSKRWKEMLGFEEHEISNSLSEWEKRVHPEDKDQTMDALQAHFDGKTPVYLHEYRFNCKDGSWIWILDRGMVVSRNASGKPVRMIGTHSDITEQRTAKDALRTQAEKLRKLKDRYQLLFHNSPDAHLIMEIDGGTITDCNQATEIMLRGVRSQIIGLRPDQLSPPFQPDGRPSLDAVAQIIQKCLAHGHHRFEWVHRRLDGEDFWAEVTISLTEVEMRQVLLVAWRDIGDRKNMEHNLRLELGKNKRFSDMMDSVGAYLFIKDRQRHYVYANRSTLELFRCTSEELIGKGDESFFTSDDALRRLTSVDNRVLETGELSRVEMAVAYYASSPLSG